MRRCARRWGRLLIGSFVAVTLEALAHGLRSRLIRGTGSPHCRRRRRSGADRRRGARPCLGLRRRRAACAGGGECAADVQRSLILRSLNDVLPPSGPIIKALNRVDPAPSIIGPVDGGRRRPIRRSPPIPTCAGPAARCSGPRDRLRPRGRGVGLAGGPGLVVTNAHVVAGEDDTTVTTRRAPRSTPPRSTTTPQTTSPCCTSRPTCRSCACARSEPGTAAAVLGYPENGPYADRPGAPRRDPRDDQPGLLRPRPDAPPDHLPARQCPQRQLRRPTGGHPRPGPGNGLRRDHHAVPREASPSPTKSSRLPWKGDLTRGHGTRASRREWRLIVRCYLTFSENEGIHQGPDCAPCRASLTRWHRAGAGVRGRAPRCRRVPTATGCAVAQ